MVNKYTVSLLKDRNTSELLKGSSIAFILRIFGIGSAYIFTFLLARWYGPDIVGIFSLIYIVIQVMAIIGKVGSDTATLKFSAEYSTFDQWDNIGRTLQKAYTMVIPFTLILSLLVFEFSSFIAVDIFHKVHLRSYIQYSAFAITPFALLFVNFEFLRGIKKIVHYSLLQSILPFAFATTIIIVLKFTDYNQPEYTIIAFIISIIITFLISLVYVRKFTLGQIRWREVFSDVAGKPSWRLFISFAFPLMIVNTISYMMGWVDTIVLGVFKSEDIVGIYNVCIRIAMLTSLPLTAINTMASPQFAALWAKKDIAGLKKIAQNSTKVIFFISLPVILITIIFPTFILSIFGKEFELGATALIILSIGQFVNAICGSVGVLLQMTNNHVVFQWVILTGTLLNLILSYLLIPKLGLNGAAISTCCAMIFWNVASLIIVKRNLGFWALNLKGS